MKPFHVLMPDKRYDGPPDLEQKVFGDLATIHDYKVKCLSDIPNHVWEVTDALMLWGELGLRCDGAMLDRLKNCRIIIRLGVGFDAVDIEEAGRRSIVVCNVPDYGTTDVADHAIGMMLGLTRGIVRHHVALTADPVGNWRAIDTPHVRRIRGTTFGIVGLGRIGSAVGLRAKAFGMNVVFYDPYLPDGTDQALGFVREETLSELLRISDVVSLHVPLTTETRNLMNQKTFSVMKCDAILVNTSRGPVVNIKDLTEALKRNIIGGVALDVQPEEPPEPHRCPLMKALIDGEEWTVGRVIVTPHAAWYSTDGVVDIRQKGARTVLNFLTQCKLRNCVNNDYIVSK